METYASHGVTFEFPSSFEQGDPIGPEGTTWSVTLLPVHGYGFVELIAYDIRESPTAAQLQAFASNYFEFVQNEASDDRPLGPMQQRSVGGVGALEARYAGALGDKHAVAFAHGTTLFGIDCSVPASNPTVADTCEHVIDSFGFQELG